MEENNRFLDPKMQAIQDDMNDPLILKKQYLNMIVKNGVDQEALKAYKNLSIEERLSRLETEMEYRTTENAKLVLNFASMVEKFFPMINQIYIHFFGENPENLPIENQE